MRESISLDAAIDRTLAARREAIATCERLTMLLDLVLFTLRVGDEEAALLLLVDTNAEVRKLSPRSEEAVRQ